MTTVQPHLSLDPAKFYGLVKIIKSIDSLKKEKINSFSYRLESELQILGTQKQKLAQANNNLFQEIRLTTRSNPLDSFEDQEVDYNKFAHTLGQKNFLIVAYNIINNIFSTKNILLETCNDLYPGSILVESDNFNTSNLNFQKLQQITFESQLNQSNIQKFISGITGLNDAVGAITDVANNISIYFDEYYKTLLKRHTEDGIKVYKDPVLTDVAMSIYENVDAHGEIESGKDINEISAYTLRKAEVILDAIKNKSVYELISKPEGFVDIICKQLTELFTLTFTFQNEFKTVLKDATTLLEIKNSKYKFGQQPDVEFYAALQKVKDINPHSIVGKESTKLFTKQEKFNLAFKNETLENIVNLLLDNTKTAINIVRYVLERKASLRKFFQEENSFYTCRIGGGNSFMGEAPGALQVIPDIKPTGTLEEIAGSNFDLVRDTVNNIESADQWNILYLATSPSRTTDKAHTLLVGPAGSGKSMALKRIGAQKNSIGIYCSGSDFGTAWKNESQKNPKRLYEAAVKLRKESKKHVHILIDEIDSVIPKKELVAFGETDLTLEFQMLMDGVIEYPGITVWGTTNHPERIATPMIRRFNLLVVGELDSKDRIRLLKDYTGCMPVSDDFSNEAWEVAANKLDGATGDVIRKVVDHIWRKKMTAFVKQNPKEAAKLVDHLKEQFEDGNFDIGAFDDKMKIQFKNKLKPYCKVNASDVQDSISLHLKNAGVYHEIQNAKETYAKAKLFVTKVEEELNL